MEQNPWEGVKLDPEKVRRANLDRPIVEPPHVDVGDAAVTPQEEGKNGR